MSNEQYLEEKRTIFVLGDQNVDMEKHMIGFFIYLLIFVLFIPYLLIKYKYWNVLSAYFPNLDMIATIIGYHGGPKNLFIWKHLYNPSDISYIGYITSNIINMFALLGVTYIIAYYTFIKRNIYKGWSRAFIMLPMTYFIPSNIIVYVMNIVGVYFNKLFESKSLIHYLLVVFAGCLVALGFILMEAGIIKIIVPYIYKLLTAIY